MENRYELSTKADEHAYDHDHQYAGEIEGGGFVTDDRLTHLFLHRGFSIPLIDNDRASIGIVNEERRSA